MFSVAVGGETAELEPCLAAGDQIQGSGPYDRAEHLGDDIAGKIARREPFPDHQSDGHRRVEMTARDMPDGVGHGEDGEAECERDAEQPDPDLRKRCGQDGTAAPSEHQPERADGFRHQSIRCRHGSSFVRVQSFPTILPFRKDVTRSGGCTGRLSRLQGMESNECWYARLSAWLPGRD